MIKKTIGGDRLGSGNKMQAALHNYERSTHDLGNVWRSTMAPGVLVPFYKKLCTNGDTWTINLQELVRTMPAIGPLFGTYKLQLDFFEVPIRLYNGILHNNMTKIGMDMSKVKLPKIQLKGKTKNPTIYNEPEWEKKQISDSSLMAYLGLRGIGTYNLAAMGEYTAGAVTRKFNAVPVLAYYDIFKNYYANKQEENAYVIDTDISVQETVPTEIRYFNLGYQYDLGPYNTPGNTAIHTGKINYEMIAPEQIGEDMYVNAKIVTERTENEYPKGSKWSLKNLVEIQIKLNGNYYKDKTAIIFMGDNGEEILQSAIERKYNTNNYAWDERWDEKTGTLTLTGFKKNVILNLINNDLSEELTWDNYKVSNILIQTENTYKQEIKLKAFPLTNIDDMRIYLLQNTTLGTEIVINDQDKFPYKANYEEKANNCSGCRNTMSGLVVKTYQSDIFNCWLSSQWIDSINGINAISAVAVEEGKFTIDALNLAHKVYNMLNRIAISGGTYEDWQEAVYGEDALRRAESPIYCGGASGYIQFEEVISTADTQTEAAGDQPLGSLAGKGTLTNAHGGNIEIHVKEPSYIMGIASITPIIDYNQGNDFDMTELDSLNDIHKPELDEIGFQDLILERAAWWTTEYDGEKWTKQAGGKQPAWLEYMTSVNQVYGEFSDRTKLGYMVLTRNYENDGNWHAENESTHIDDDAPNQRYSTIADWTTYINPTKFNYQFADTSLSAQNFWVQIGINATVRRKISAKLIPNL